MKESFAGSVPEYYDSCLGPAWFDALAIDLAQRRSNSPKSAEGEALPVAAERLFRKAGFDVDYPEGLAELCCGQPQLPIVFDTSPCAYRMKLFCGERLAVRDGIEFIHDAVLCCGFASDKGFIQPAGVERACVAPPESIHRPSRRCLRRCARSLRLASPGLLCGSLTPINTATQRQK